MKCPVFKDLGSIVKPVISDKYPYVYVRTVLMDRKNETLTPMDSSDLRKIADYLDNLKFTPKGEDD